MLVAAETVGTWERHAGAACAPLGEYRRREPERTLLHAVVRERLEPFLARARERSAHGHGLPAFVEGAFRAYLDCGILARGFVRIRCPGCGFERLVGFSCKGAVCPSCNARRMEDAAEHLVANVFPEVPVRQWVLSFPRRVRFLAARHPRLASRLLNLFTRAVFAWQRRVARRLGADDPRTGGVTAVQRFGGALNLNVHFHTLVPDGVFLVEGEGPAAFLSLPPPTQEDLEAILARVIRRTAKVLPGFDDAVESEEDALAALQAAEVDRRLRFPDPFRSTRTSASLDGFSLHAGVRVHESDRDGLERLCRYAVRPPFALDRLSRGEDGRLVYRMKRPRGGSLFLLLTPDELLAKLATLVPPPRVHGIRYHGVFAPNCKVRPRVVPPPPEPDSGADPDASAPRPPAATLEAGAASIPPAGRCAPNPPRDRPARVYRVPWADLLRKVFALDVLACPDCGGRLRVLAFITEGRDREAHPRLPQARFGPASPRPRPGAARGARSSARGRLRGPGVPGVSGADGPSTAWGSLVRAGARCDPSGPSGVRRRLSGWAGPEAVPVALVIRPAKTRVGLLTRRGARVRVAADLPPRRRRPVDRLEGDGAARGAGRARVAAGAKPDGLGAPRLRPAPVGPALRRPDQARPRRGRLARPRARRRGARGSRGGGALRSRGPARRAARRRPRPARPARRGAPPRRRAGRGVGLRRRALVVVFTDLADPETSAVLLARAAWSSYPRPERPAAGRVRGPERHGAARPGRRFRLGRTRRGPRAHR